MPLSYRRRSADGRGIRRGTAAYLSSYIGCGYICLGDGTTGPVISSLRLPSVLGVLLSYLSVTEFGLKLAGDSTTLWTIVAEETSASGGDVQGAN